jgi:hypothetical protein
MHVPPLAFFITKYFGSGVIIATAFIHVSQAFILGGEVLLIYTPPPLLTMHGKDTLADRK